MFKLVLIAVKIIIGELLHKNDMTAHSYLLDLLPLKLMVSFNIYTHFNKEKTRKFVKLQRKEI